MQWAFCRIPVTGGSEAEELNRFLRTVRVMTCHREFVAHGDGSFWAMAVEYLPAIESGVRTSREAAAGKVDFKNVLSPDDFALFARLREWRKQIANTDAVPVYTVFTNEQLAEIARRRCSSLTLLTEIDGIGQGKIDKYGTAVLDVIKGFSNGQGEGTLPSDSRV